MNTVETFLSLTGRTKIYAGQERMLRGEFDGTNDPEAAAHIEKQLAALTLTYVRTMGLMPRMEDVAPFVDLRAWEFAKNGNWSRSVVPFRPRTVRPSDPLSAKDRNPVFAFYTEVLGRAPDEAGLKFWTEEIMTKVLPAMKRAAQEQGELK